MKVAIHHNDKHGFVKYNPGNQEVMVTHPDEAVRNTVRHYLTNERTFITAGSSDLDKKGFRVPIYSKPNESVDTITMGLCEMFHNTGVHVNWGHDENELKEITGANEPDPNAQADKPILKSLFGEEDYEIIN